MPKVRKNVLVRGLSGMLGDQVVFRHMRDGNTVVAVKPDFSSRKFSEEQTAHQSRFREGVAYAREASKTKPIYTVLAAGTMKNAYNIALSDWFNPPVIHEVTREAGLIRVRASDNVKVAGVRVVILEEEGKRLETIEATQVNDEWWEATCTAERVTVEARDLAGNVTVG